MKIFRAVAHPCRAWRSLLLLLPPLVSCGGGGTDPAPPPLPPPPSSPVATVEVAPSARSLAIGETAQFTAIARSAAGTTLTGRSVTWSSDRPATASVSGGGLVTATSAGVATITATIEGRSGSAVVSVTSQLPAPTCRDCLELVPGNLLLPAVGAQQQLSAFLVDAAGTRTPVQATYNSSRAGVISVSPAGLATATGLGSAQITAQGGGKTSAPLLVVVAVPVAGTFLIPDDSVERAPAPVNALAELGIGYRYTIRVRGTPPTVGQMMSGTGNLPILGRVERVTPAGAGLTEVELEVRPLKEIFPNFSLNESWDLDVPATAAGFAGAPGDGPPGQIIQRPLKEGEFLVGPFTCKVDAGVALTIPLSLLVEAIEVNPDLRAELAVIDGELRSLAVRGELRPRAILTPRVQAAVTASITCKVILYELPVQVPGPLALLVKPEVPVGLGFQFGGALPAETGARVGIQGSASIGVAWACSSGVCVDVTDNSATLDGIFEPLVGGPATGQVDLTGSVFAFAALELTNPIVEQLSGLKIKLLEAQAGLRQRITVAAISVQAASPTYASEAYLTLFNEVTSEATASLAGLWQLELWSRSSSDSLIVASTPRGSLQVTPASVMAGTTAEPGDTARFRVTLTTTTWLTLEAVEGVEIFRSTPEGLVSVCGFLAREQPQQAVYECKRTFLEEESGNHDFYAFVTAKIYGVPFATPFEVAPNSKATLQVGPPLDGEAVVYHVRAHSTPHGSGAFTCIDETIQGTGTSASISAQVACAGGGGDFLATAQLTSTISGGGLKATASRGATSGYSNVVIGSSAVMVEDVVVIHAPGLAGTPGSFRVQLEIGGAWSVSGPCLNLTPVYAAWDVRGHVAPMGGGAAQFMFNSSNGHGSVSVCQPGGYGMPLPGTAESSPVVFTYGVPFRLSIDRSVTAKIGVTSAGPVPAWSASIDATFRWMGLTGLPANATLTSATGVDWSKPVQP